VEKKCTNTTDGIFFIDSLLQLYSSYLISSTAQPPLISPDDFDVIAYEALSC
jgi:hypothetical protein